LLTTHTRTFTSSSLQFFFTFLFLSILSRRVSTWSCGRRPCAGWTRRSRSWR
jgi:hypothetical protein